MKRIRKLYVKEAKQWVEVNDDVYFEIQREYDRIRKKAQYHGQCSCPQNKTWLCNSDCVGCEFRMAGNTLSLDYEMEAAAGGGFTLLDMIDDDTSDLEEILARKVLHEQIHQLLGELNEHDRIICVGLAVGKSERAIAKELGLTQSTLSYQKRKMLTRLAKEYPELEGLL